MNDYYTRYDIAKLSGRGYRAIMLMDKAQLVPGRIQIESGARNLKFRYNKHLVDEWLIYMASCVLGDKGRGAFSLPELHTMADKKNLQWQDIRHIGRDLRMTLQQF